MRRSILIISILSAWLMAAVFSRIKNTTGLEIDVLLYAAIITMVLGLYKGLKTDNKDCTNKEL